VTPLYLAGGALLLVLAVVAAAYLLGRGSGGAIEQRNADQRAAEIKDEQLQDSTLPRDPASVVGRLRRHDF